MKKNVLRFFFFSSSKVFLLFHVTHARTHTHRERERLLRLERERERGGGEKKSKEKKNTRSALLFRVTF